MLFSDRLEIWNPGELPLTLTLDELRRPHASIRRKPLIAEPMFLARYAEKAGGGILDMIARCRELGQPAPEFRQSGGQFIQMLGRPQVVQPVVTPDTTVQVTVQVTDQVTGQFTGQVAARVLGFCRTPKSGKEIQTLVGIRHRETFLVNYLTPLIEVGWLTRTIPDKPQSRSQKYRLTDAGQAWLAAQRPGGRK